MNTQKNIKNKHLKERLNVFITSIIDLYEDSFPIGITTHLEAINNHFSGLTKGDLMIIAGRPFMGKTSFVTNMIGHIAVNNKQAAGILSIEHDDIKIMQYITSFVSGICIDKLKSGRLDTADWSALTHFVHMASNTPLYVEHLSFDNIEMTTAQIENFITSHHLEVLAIDDFPFLLCNESTSPQKVMLFVKQLKQLATKYNCCILMTAGVSHDIDRREDKRPLLSDLSINGDISTVADIILCLYRDDFYHPNPTTKGITDILVRKNYRNGFYDSFSCLFKTETVQFVDYKRYEDYYDHQEEYWNDVIKSAEALDAGDESYSAE